MKYTDEQRVQKIGETTAKLLAYLKDNAISHNLSRTLAQRIFWERMIHGIIRNEGVTAAEKRSPAVITDSSRWDFQL